MGLINIPRNSNFLHEKGKKLRFASCQNEKGLKKVDHAQSLNYNQRSTRRRPAVRILVVLKSVDLSFNRG